MKNIPVILLGAGRVGRALARQLLSRDSWWAGREGFSFKLRAIADSTGLLVGRPLLDEATVRAALDGKERGQPFSPTVSPASWLYTLPETPAVIVDATTAQDTGPRLLEAIRRGHSVVLLNDAPLARDVAFFRTLTADRRTRFEAVIGAGLPLIETLERFIDTGERIESIQALLSPRLTAAFSALEAGASWNKAVRAAAPTPSDSDPLGEQAAARQGLILSRCLGADLRLEAVRIERLPDFSQATHAEQLAARLAEAKRAGRSLRHLVTVTRNQVTVGLRELPSTSPLSAVRSGVAVAVHTASLGPSPLVVQGPGEGVERAALAALGDLLVLAREEDKPWRRDRLERGLRTLPET